MVFSFAHMQRWLSWNGDHEGRQVKTSVSLSLLFFVRKALRFNVVK